MTWGRPSILVIIWHLLADQTATFTDLGADHYTRNINPNTKKRNHIRQLEALGYTVTLTPGRLTQQPASPDRHRTAISTCQLPNQLTR